MRKKKTLPASTKKYLKSIATALVCFVLVFILNFLLPRLLPGDPVAYLTGMDEEGMTPTQYEYYRQQLHLDENIFVQFGYYAKSIFDGTLGYSYNKNDTVSNLISSRIGITLQITLSAVFITAVLGLVLGLATIGRSAKSGKAVDLATTPMMIILNTLPTFVIGMVLLLVFCFKLKVFPFKGANTAGVAEGTVQYFFDRIYHLAMPVLTIVLASLPSRYLLVRNQASQVAEQKYVVYAKMRGLSPTKVRFGYILPNIAQPFIAMVGMSVGASVGGSLIVENIFSVNGMGRLLQQAINSLDYPLMQGILFVTALIMTISIVIADVICILIDPKLRKGVKNEL